MKEKYLVDCNRKFIVYTDNKDAEVELKDENDLVFVQAGDMLNAGENRLKKFIFI